MKIHGVDIKPGTRQTIMLPMPKLYDWTPLSMPVHVIRGHEDGPVLCLTGALHGDEVTGVAIIRRLLKKKAIKDIRGTLIAIPVLNGYGFLHQTRCLMDRRDLNRSFPGSETGSLASRMAHLIVTEILQHATHIIDFHAGSSHRFNLPHLRVDLETPGVKAMANAFHVPVVLHAKQRAGSIRQFASNNKIPCLVYEGGEALRLDELSVRTGLEGTLSVMRELGMIAQRSHATKKFTQAFARASYWIRASHSGIWRPYKNLGRSVNKGQLLAKIGNPTGTDDFNLMSPISGIIIGKTNMPIVHEGAALFHIACFEQLDMVAEQIQYLQDSYEEESNGL